MSSSALPFFSSRSRIGEAIYDIDIYDLNAAHKNICLKFFMEPGSLIPAQIKRGLPAGVKPPGSNYSVRNAAIGLMRVARRAGSQVAISVAAPSNRGAVENAIGSSAPT